MTSNMGSIVSRLQGLKNVSGRRVMPGQQAEEMAYEDPELSTASEPMDMQPPVNTPQQNISQFDTGAQLTPKSYDVRANVVTPSSYPDNLQKIGKYLGNPLSAGVAANQTVAQEPPVETAQVDQSEGLPPVTASEQEVDKRTTFQKLADLDKKGQGSIGDFFSGITKPIMDWASPTKSAEAKAERDEVFDKVQGKVPAEIEKAVAEPFQHSVYGSAFEVSKNPALSAQFKEITGIDYTPEIAERVSKHELAMQGVEDALKGIHEDLGEEANQIRDRIAKGMATDEDKWYIGMALAMPLLVGGFFGSEAGFKALAGGAGAVADVLNDRDNKVREDEGMLTKVKHQQADTQSRIADVIKEKANYEPELRSSLPKNPEAHLEGMQGIEYKNPSTGKIEKATRLAPGFVAKNEYLASKEDKQLMQKAAKELTEVKGFVDDVDDITEDIIEIASQLKDKNILSKAFSNVVAGKEPSINSKLTPQVKLKDGRVVNAGSELGIKLGMLANKYAAANKLGQLDKALQTHIDKIFNNPTTSFVDGQDTINQMISIRNLGQKGLIKSAESNGFIPDFLAKDYKNKNKKVDKGLSKKADDKAVEDVTLKLIKREPKYANKS